MRPDSMPPKAVDGIPRPSPTDAGSDPSETPNPRVNAKGPGRAQGRQSEAPAGSQASCELSSLMRNEKPEK